MHLKAALFAVVLSASALCVSATAQQLSTRIGDESFSVEAPADWFTEQGFATVSIANSEAALRRFESHELGVSDAVVQVVLLPADWFAQRKWFGGPAEASASEDVFLGWVLSLLRPTVEYQANLGMGEVEPTTLGSGLPAAQVPISAGDLAGLIIVSRPAEGVVAVTSAASGSALSIASLAREVAASVDFQGTGQSLSDALAAATN